MSIIAKTLDDMEIGDPINFQSLTLFPIIAPSPMEPDYVSLEEAIAKGSIQITEVSAGGSVPELKLVNKSEERVLLLDGEELVGAKQNRILNLTILVPPKAEIVIPVSCVEQGRWSYRLKMFSTSNHGLFAKARARKAEQVSSSLSREGSRRSHQGEIWNAVSEKSAKLHSHSPTSAMSDIYTSHSERIKKFQKAFTPAEKQVGAIFAVNGKIAGMDLFDSDRACRKFLNKLVAGYALDALEEAEGEQLSPSRDAVASFIKAIKEAQTEKYRAIGEGEDVRIANNNIAGGALLFQERLVHLCAFQNV